MKGERRRESKRQAALLASALETADGRHRLAMRMAEPIRLELEYEVLGGRLFMVDELPQSATATYSSDVTPVATVATTTSVMPSPPISLPELGRIGIGTSSPTVAFQTGYVGTAGIGSFAIGSANTAEGTYGSFRLGRPQNTRKPYPPIKMFKT